MALWRILLARLRGCVRRDGVADEIREEIAFHTRMRAEEFERSGASAGEARRRARLRVGNPAVLLDRGYDERGGGFMETIAQDVRYGLRLLWRQRGFSSVAILTLALGIGLSTALASVLDAALVRALPYPRPAQLVRVAVSASQPSGRVYQLAVSWDDVLTLRTAAHDLTTVSMSRFVAPSPIADGPSPERLAAREIDDAYLALYGVSPLIGRGFTAADLPNDAPPVVILGYDYWQRRFQGSPAALGQTIHLDQGNYTIVGVLPSTFGRGTPIWRPLHLEDFLRHMRGSGAGVEARVRGGATLAAAQSEVDNVLARVPNARTNQHAVLSPLLDAALARYRTTEEVLGGAVLLILVIACVNVAGLLLARGATRQPELAVRASIGAGRGRLIRQLLTESVLLAAVGGLAGVVLAWWSLDTLVANIPMSLPSDAPASLNWRVLAFSSALAVTTGVLFGLAPAFVLSRVDISTTLARGSRRVGASLSRRGGQLLITIETALAVVLLMGAGLMLRSFTRILDVNLGFRPESIVTLESTPVALDAQTYVTYYQGLVQRARALRGVAAAGAIDDLPLKGSASFMQVSTATRSASTISAGVRTILPGYFEAMGLTPTAGRLPTDADVAAGRHVVIINTTAADDIFARTSAIGQAITVGGELSEVIGVVPDVRFNGPIDPVGFGGNEATRPLEIFRLSAVRAGDRAKALVLVVRPTGVSPDLGDRLRQLAQQVGPAAIVERIRRGDEWLDATIVTPRRRTVLLTLMGGLGLVLTLVGIFGMTAYAVARRTQEIGVRMAFGARPAEVVGTMLRDATVPVAVGLVVGIGGAALATRLIESFLFQTTPTDAGTFAAVATTLAVAAVLAAWIPARRAARVDPVQALRAE